MMVGDSQQETMDLGLVLFDTRQQGKLVILGEHMLPDGFEPMSPNFTVRDVTIGRIKSFRELQFLQDYRQNTQCPRTGYHEQLPTMGEKNQLPVEKEKTLEVDRTQIEEIIKLHHETSAYKES
ncbi:unnamed protein product [Schistosoma margrebowiei]|uniref:Uncharacterized protein n=1 Tax=Schistosoma margrebowiei TaxID=48269 RepID=A0A183MGQ8_9TREM|nr:unnamed protein product [Schistosoma margrebowiei]